jgi:hypothetical protein
MIIFWLATLGASIVTAILVALVYLTARGKPPLVRVVAPWAGRLWLFNFVLDLFILYFAMPALTGPYLGGQWLLWPLLLTGVIALFGGSLLQMRFALDSFGERVNSSSLAAGDGLPWGRGRRPAVVDDRKPRSEAPRTSGTAGVVAMVLVVVVALLANGIISVATTWFDPNAKALAAIPTIIMEPASQKLPATDVNHIVMVTSGVAAYLGQQVLASNGQNLGSLYHTDQGEYTLQSVRGHLYWIAPLVYNNVWANLGRWESPGFVVVDAEDPNVQPKLMTGYHMRYLPDALFNQELSRHVYLSGYTNGDLEEATLEVDDNWQPYFTITLMQPSRGFTGEVVKSVLLVDPQSGSIHSYQLGQVPSWVDRVIPGGMVTQYLTWWGQYAHAPWFNPSGSGQQVPGLAQGAGPELVYNTADQPVWLVPMTSSSMNDQSSTGVILFDTKDMTGRYYPLSGLGVADNVETIFASNPQNIRNYAVTNVQLYSIYGEPTWVANFVQGETIGDSFQAIGIVDAKHLNGANVIMAANKTQALAGYAQWLADHNIQTPASPTGKTVSLQGRVTRISSATQNGTTVYYLLLEGQTRIFEAGLALNPELPLVQPGDQVQVNYLDTGQSFVTLTSFDDLSIHVAGGASTPGPTGTPAP